MKLNSYAKTTLVFLSIPIVISIFHLGRWGENSTQASEIVRDLRISDRQYFELGQSIWGQNYAPSIIKSDGAYHTFWCSPGEEGAWDYIRYSKSKNLRSWSEPSVVLTAKPFVSPGRNLPENHAACDPSLVYFQGYYYLYYSNAIMTKPAQGDQPPTYKTVITVARSRSISGPYKTYTKRKTWESKPQDPQILIFPASLTTSSYGAGQQTVVNHQGKLYMWYTDDSDYEKGGSFIKLRVSNSPVDWEEATEIKVDDLAIVNYDFDMKYDPVQQKFVAIGIQNRHSPNSQLLQFTSEDGRSWSKPVTVIEDERFPDYAHNVGISSDREGHLIDPEETIVGFGAPIDFAREDRWGIWNLYGIRIDLSQN